MTQGSEKGSSTAAGIALRVGMAAVFTVVQAALLLGGAGRLNWSRAWVCIGISLATLAVGGAIMLRTSAETIAERGRPRGMQRYDKLVTGVWPVAGFVALPLLAGLDARLGWHAAGAAVLAPGYGLTIWAMRTNVYSFTAVHIQAERSFAACSSGTYRTVRHPGYVGYMLQYLALPSLLGSLWAPLPWLAAAVSMVIRTALEDHWLRAELPGCPEHGRQVRWRLTPEVW